MRTAYNDLTFHVGPHKTGSTTLQDYVFPKLSNVHFLKNPGLVSVGRVLSRQEGSVLVSSEDLSGVPFGKDYNKRRIAMYEFLASAFPGSAIMVVLRNPPDVVASLYHQYLKMGGSRFFDEFVAERMDLAAFEYGDMINVLGELPFSKVSVFFFEDLFAGSGSVDQILAHDDSWRYSADIGSEEKRVVWANRSLKRNGARALRSCNALAFRMGLGSMDWQPIWNRYWPRRLNMTPPKWLSRWPLRYLDRCGPRVTEGVRTMPEMRALEVSYAALRDQWRRAG